jgi:hypothetical protein
MPDWQTIIDSDDFPEPTPEESPRPRSRQKWWVMVGIILVLVVFGFVTLQRQQVIRQTAIKNDLTAFIFEEETVRYFGDPDQVTDLAIAGVSPTWQQAYRQTFQIDRAKSPPNTIILRELDFDGQCAVVTAELDEVAQKRAYCLNDEQQWRRAPLSPVMWGAQDFIDLSNDIRLGFRTHDRAFAETLARDLPQFFEELSELTSSRVDVAEIIVEPGELLPPLVYQNEQLLVVNSPQLSNLDKKFPSGEIAIRLALAEALLRQVNPVLGSDHPLPGEERFQRAAQTVLAMHLFLSPEEQEILLDAWHRQFDEQWVSPFFADTLPIDETVPTQTMELAAILTAEYIYQVAGAKTLNAMLPQLATTKSWDSLFQASLNRSTIALENDVAIYIKEGDLNGYSSPNNAIDASLPLKAALVNMVDQGSSGIRATVVMTNQKESVLVELLPDAKFQTAEGPLIPAGCVMPGSSLTIDGEWLEIQRRVQATELTVQHNGGFDIKPAPADTIAYLVKGESPDEQDLAVERTFPQTRLYLTSNELFVPQVLVALRENGTIQTLMPLSATQQVVSLPITPGGSPHFLFVVDLPNCERTWFVHYDPMVGVTGQWLSPPPPIRWVWREDRQNLMFTNPSQDTTGQNIYETDHALSPHPVSKSTIPVSLVGWNMPREQLVFTKSWIGTTSIGLLDPGSGAISRAKVYVHPMRARQLSPDGKWLAYLTGVNNLFDPPYRLDLFSVEDLSETTLIRLTEDEGIGPATWSLYLDQPRLAVLTGPLLEDDMLRPTRLLTAEPGRPEEYVTVAEASDGEQLATPVFCADGRLLFRSYQDGRFQLKRQAPGLSPQTLFSLDTPFQPLACS